MQGMASPTTTHYALLGLLAIRPWPAYELVGQSQRVLGFLWPRAESKVYESVKRLTVLGLASAERQRTGRRPRTVYSITPAGRQALREWLRQPGTGPALEFTAAIKLFYADHGDTQDALATLAAVTEWAQRVQATGAAIGREFVDTDGGPFPERLHINTLIYEFLLRHAVMVSDWAAWATEQVRDWDGTGPQPHRHDADLDNYRRGAAIRTTAGSPAPTPPSQARR